MTPRATAAIAVVALAATAVPARADDGDRWDGATIGVQVGGGVAGAVLGGGIGGGIGLLAGSAGAKQGDWGRPLLGALLGVVVGGEVGILAGVQYGGDQRDGTGRWWGTLLGGAGGLAVAGVMTYYGARAKLSYAELLLIGATFVIGGPIIGYQLSGDAHPPPDNHGALPLITLTF